MNHVNEIQKIIEGIIHTDDLNRATYSHDASLFEVIPQAIIEPKTVGDIEKIVSYISQNATTSAVPLSITARGAGTDMSGGPLTESLVLEMRTYFNTIKKIELGSAIAQPGVYYRDFEKATLAQVGQIIPSYPASRDLCTVGGMVANNSGGEKTLTYGKTNRYVKRIDMVTADGKMHTFQKMSLHELEQAKKFPTFESEIYRKMHDLITQNMNIIERAKPIVTKNSSGYALWDVLNEKEGTFDLTQLLVGSQGTLGIMTEVELKLITPKKASRLLVIFLKDMNMLGRISQDILTYKPESFESYDDHTFKVAVKFLPSLVRKMKGGFFKLMWQFMPEAWAVVRGGVPKMVLMAEFTADTDLEALAQVKKAYQALRGYGVHMTVTDNAEETSKYWTIRRESFNMLRQHVKGVRTAPFIDDFVVPVQSLPTFLPRLYALLGQYEHEMTYTVAGHVGDGNFHIIPLMNLNNPRSTDIIQDLSVKVYTLVSEYHGSITGEHNDGIIRTPFIEMQFGKDMCKLFAEVKYVWDPKGIFNPGKKVGGTLEYAFQHIVKKS